MLGLSNLHLSDLRERLDQDEYVHLNRCEMTLAVKPLHLIFREKENRIFKRPSYTYTSTQFSLCDILVSSDGSGDPKSSLLNGDASFIDDEGLQCGQTSGSGAVTSSDFIESHATSEVLTGLKVKKVDELDIIIKNLQGQWFFDKKLELWARIANPKTKCELCFITGVVVAQENIDISYEHRASGCFRDVMKELREVLRRYWMDRTRSFKITKGTVLAYKVQEIEVDSTSGRITLPHGKMSKSGDSEMTFLNIDPEEEIANCRLYLTTYFRKISSKKQAELRKALKKLLPTAPATNEPPDASKEYTQWDGIDEGIDWFYSSDQLLDCDGSSNVRHLGLFMKMANDALPTVSNPKQKEIENLLHKLGVSDLLDLPNELDAVYGICYFITALWCLPPEALSWLCKCANEDEEHESLQAVEELERLLYCVVEWDQYTVTEVSQAVKNFLSLALLEEQESFLNAWRAAYVSAIYMCSLPLPSAKT